MNKVHTEHEIELYQSVNTKLAKLALVLPPYALNINDIILINELLESPTKNKEKIESSVLTLPIMPKMRAGILVHRVSIIPAFKEFSYRLEYAYLDFCRRNIPGAMCSMLTIIEGMIRRWAKTADKKVGNTFDVFLRNSPKRAINTPKWRMPFVESWSNACACILEDHLYKNTERRISDFNRHAIVHDTEESFDYKRKGMNLLKRAFLVVDLIIELYVLENNIPVRIFYDVSTDDPHFAAYYKAIMEGMSGEAPEQMIDKLYD